MTLFIDGQHIRADRPHSDANLLKIVRARRENARKCRALINDLRDREAIRLLSELADDLEQTARELELLAHTEAAA